MKKAIVVTVGLLIVAALALAIIPATRDEIHWLRVSHKNETASYKSYVETWPNGRHADEARERYDELGWADARAANTIRTYQDYSKTHPQGLHLQEAKTKTDVLRKADAPYQSAMKAGTEASLRKFLEDFPGHQMEVAVRQAIKDITEGRDIVDALKEKKIEVQATGNGIQNVSVRIRKLVSYPLTVRIPVGTFFVSANPSAQNMVTTAESKVQLTSNEWELASPDAACANRPRDIPAGDDTFTVQRSPNRAELAKLVPVMEKAGVPYAVRQAAVWIVTDNANYDDLGILVSRSPYQVFGGSRQINEHEAALAMRILDEAGINIKQKSIWQDRQTIISGLKDDDLKKWLKEKK
jgi:hypothetical protein